MKPVRYEFQPVVDGWGICLGQGGKWHVLFGDAEQFIFSGVYRNRRRAKKEITHYIKHGASWCQHGMRRKIAELQKVQAMLKLKIYSVKDFTAGKQTFKVGWVNPNHIIQISLLDDTGFSVFTMVNGSRGLVDKDGYNQLLQHFGIAAESMRGD